MPNLSWNEIQDRAVEFASKWQGETYEKGESQSFWSDFLSVYGIDRRRHGAFFEYAIKKGNGKQGFIDMFWPGKLLAEQKSGGKDLAKAGIQAYEYLETMPDHDLPQAIVLSDFTAFQFINLATREKVEFSLNDFPKHVKLFAFLINQESQHLAEENPVNRKAAEAMARLHNQLRDDNYSGHDLELLLVRLVFCMFADDSGIFDSGVLRSYLTNRTYDDGSDLGSRLTQVFEVLNTRVEQRQNSLDEAIVSLPYVNGGLFAEPIRTPSFTSDMRRDLLKAMELDWSKVSPAIFGSMFQGVMDEKQRRNLGAHYTSEKNILRVIKPLFLDDLYGEFTAAVHSGPRKKFDELRKLQDKIAKLKFLDPACGCGNFLVITYRELRKLEHKILAILAKGNETVDMFATAGAGVSTIKVNVDQMYGIEIEEFPSLIAQTALWLTDHQMNMEYSRQSGTMFKRLPLTASATIVNDNALTKDWTEIITPSELDYILGNPPFIGSKMMTEEMRNDLLAQFPGAKGAGVLDFVTAWYSKATTFMKQNPAIQTALVSTNSIIQGEQVPILWKYLFDRGVRINFLHQTFKWSNDAKGNAAVYCTIVGFALFDKPRKRIFEYEDIKSEPNEVAAKNINGYGIDAPNIIVEGRSKPFSSETPIVYNGSVPADGGNLILSNKERAAILFEAPELEPYIKAYIGSEGLINNKVRYCLWLVDCQPNLIRQSARILHRIQGVVEMRRQSSKKATQEKAQAPTLFTENRQPSEGVYLAIPRTSSENRIYIPMKMLGVDVIAANDLQIIPGASLYHFGILISMIHMTWMATTSGRLKGDYRYSVRQTYNTFVWPEVTELQKAEIEKLAQAVLDARAQFPAASLADLYDPLTMPPELTKAHKTLDRAVDKLYQTKPFATDAERVALLFEKYQEKVDVK